MLRWRPELSESLLAFEIFGSILLSFIGSSPRIFSKPFLKLSDQIIQPVNPESGLIMFLQMLIILICQQHCRGPSSTAGNPIHNVAISWPSLHMNVTYYGVLQGSTFHLPRTNGLIHS